MEEVSESGGVNFCRETGFDVRQGAHWLLDVSLSGHGDLSGVPAQGAWMEMIRTTTVLPISIRPAGIVKSFKPTASAARFAAYFEYLAFAGTSHGGRLSVKYPD